MRSDNQPFTGSLIPLKKQWSLRLSLALKTLLQVKADFREGEKEKELFARKLAVMQLAQTYKVRRIGFR